MRNDVILQLLYDTGLRVSELVALDVDMVETEEGVLMLLPEIQKGYPNDSNPSYTEIELADETVRSIQLYLDTRWKESPALFPSRQRDRMTDESVRNVVTRAAEEAGVRPYTVTGRGEPASVSPHTLRHSVAYRMLNREDGNTIYDVTKRLRHASVQTTERVYAHFDRV